MSLSIRSPGAAIAVVSVLLAAGCAAAPPRPKPSAAAVAACRGRTEQVFNRQNRDLLSYRDGRDTPFSNSYDSGITTAGLTRQYDHDQLYSSCLNASGASPNAGDDTSYSRQNTDPPTLSRP